jgi:hypothetical protein
VNPDDLDARLQRIHRQPFRARFRLYGRDRAVVDLRGITTVRKHAAEIIQRRLAPAQPLHDGRQTPYHGHPVFVAQHATATCCRACLERWHAIPAGRPLTDTEQAYVVDIVCRWIEHQYTPRQPPR